MNKKHFNKKVAKIEESIKELKDEFNNKDDDRETGEACKKDHKCHNIRCPYQASNYFYGCQKYSSRNNHNDALGLIKKNVYKCKLSIMPKRDFNWS